MKKIKASFNYLLGLLMCVVTFIGLFISTYGYNTNEVINYDPTKTINDAKKIFHSLGNGFTGIKFSNGGMILQSIFQIFFIILLLGLIFVCVLGILKKFDVVKEDALIKESLLKSLLNWGSLLLVLFEVIVLIGYVIASKSMHFALGLGIPFNLIVMVLCIFGTRILEAKLTTKVNK